ncbi:MAG TPA: ankyrin repeat domain-containing protein [Burkholderiales bacterium]
MDRTARSASLFAASSHPRFHRVGARLPALLLALFLPAAGLAGDPWTEAIKAHDAKAVVRLVAAGADVNRPGENGQTALMLAAAEGRHGLLRALLARGARVDAANSRGGTALMYAATAGDAGAVALLIEHGASLNARAANGWTALTLAAARGFDGIVRLLLEHGADPNIPDIYGWTALMRAADANRAASVRALLGTHRTDVDARDENGHSALHHAAAQGYEDIVQLLIDAGADPAARDRDGRTPGTLAALQGHRALALRLNGARRN